MVDRKICQIYFGVIAKLCHYSGQNDDILKYNKRGNILIIRSWNWNTIGTVGAFVVAVLALFRPDIESFYKGEKIVASLPSEFVLNHRLGVLWVLPWIDLKNEGGNTVDIKKMELYLIDSDNKITKLVADSYYDAKSSPDNFLPWTNLSIEKNQHPLERVNFREPLDHITENNFRQIISELGEYWGDMGPNTPKPIFDQSEDIKYKSKVLLAKAKDFFNSKFHITHGSYRMLLVLKSADNKIITESAYQFTIFESTIKALSNRVNEILYRPESFFDGSLLTSIPLTPIEDTKEIGKINNIINL
ncbi:hypothetical protein [Dickeya zeae]|uniref:hypothetical protein n=1 Tax=Dickeya zeae TaxID=204042 RepID=UPI0020982DAB|nr:hypothetical protein [Dickeya zeae]MCO7262407.1 hypothetical protein [Dickeya zeae]